MQGIGTKTNHCVPDAKWSASVAIDRAGMERDDVQGANGVACANDDAKNQNLWQSAGNGQPDRGQLMIA